MTRDGPYRAAVGLRSKDKKLMRDKDMEEGILKHIQNPLELMLAAWSEKGAQITRL